MSNTRIDTGDVLQELLDDTNSFSEAFHWNAPTKFVAIPEDSAISGWLGEASACIRRAQVELETLVYPYRIAMLQWLLAEAEFNK